MSSKKKIKRRIVKEGSDTGVPLIPFMPIQERVNYVPANPIMHQEIENRAMRKRKQIVNKSMILLRRILSKRRIVKR